MRKVLPLFLFLFLSSLACAQDGDSHELTIGGIFQSRYAYTFNDDQENLSSFYLRRIRLDIRGHVYSERLTYRIRPEFARSPGLEDAWVNYEAGDGYQIRFGLVQIPFHWHRFISSTRHMFVERGVPSESFGFPAGRDFGFLIHGKNEAETIAYKAGIFDGAGYDSTMSNSDGNMISARVTLAGLGQLPNDESDVQHSPNPGLSFGLGLQAANKNQARQWDLDRSASGNNRAGWVTGTADVSLRWMGWSLVADGYLRQVSPEAADVDDYKGWAYLATAGYFILPKRLELAARYSSLRLDAEDPDTSEREMGFGLNIYHRGHDVKTSIQYLTQRDNAPAEFWLDGLFLVETQVLF
ncbi:MAG: porin [Balneolales bacterium]